MSDHILRIRHKGQDWQVRHKPLNVAASASLETAVAAPSGDEAGFFIAVLGLLCVTGDTATEATLFSGSTAISPLLANGINSGVILPTSERPWFVCKPSEALKITTGAGSATGFQLIYAILPP